MKKCIFLIVFILCATLIGCNQSPAVPDTSEPTTSTTTSTSVATTEAVITVGQPYYYPFSAEDLEPARKAALDYTAEIVPKPDAYARYDVIFLAYDPILTDTLVRQKLTAQIRDQVTFFSTFAAFTVHYQHAFYTEDGYEDYQEGLGSLFCQQEEGKWKVISYSPTGGTKNIMTPQQLENFHGAGAWIAGYSDGIDGCHLFAVNTQSTALEATELTQSQLLPSGRELTAAEMTFFEDLLMYDMADPEKSWYNMSLKSLYDTPAQIDLYQLFYSAPWGDLSLSEEDLAFVKEHGLDPEISFVHKYPAEKMNEVLLKHLGITLEQTDGVGLDQFLYNPDTDCYYDMHGDLSMGYPNFLKGIQSENGDVIIFYEMHSFVRDMQDFAVTLRQQEDGTYWILSNRLAGMESQKSQ